MSNLQDHMTEQNAITAAAEQEARRTRGPDYAPRATKKRNTELESEVAAQRIVIASLQNQLSGGNPGSSTPMIDAIHVELPGETDPMLQLIAEIMAEEERDQGYALMAYLGRQAIKTYRNGSVLKDKALPGLLACLIVYCDDKGIDFTVKLAEAQGVADLVLHPRAVPDQVEQPADEVPMYSIGLAREGKRMIKEQGRVSGANAALAIEEILVCLMQYCAKKGMEFDEFVGEAKATCVAVLAAHHSNNPE